jgi:hypothetical protein
MDIKIILNKIEQFNSENHCDTYIILNEKGGGYFMLMKHNGDIVLSFFNAILEIVSIINNHKLDKKYTKLIPKKPSTIDYLSTKGMLRVFEIRKLKLDIIISKINDTIIANLIHEEGLIVHHVNTWSNVEVKLKESSVNQNLTEVHIKNYIIKPVFKKYIKLNPDYAKNINLDSFMSSINTKE